MAREPLPDTSQSKFHKNKTRKQLLKPAKEKCLATYKRTQRRRLASHQEDERGRKASHSHERVLIFFFLVKAKNLTSSKNTLKKKDK